MIKPTAYHRPWVLLPVVPLPVAGNNTVPKAKPDI